MKRKRNTKLVTDAPLVTEPETSHSRSRSRLPHIGQRVVNERTEGNFSSFGSLQTEIETPRSGPVRRVDLVTEPESSRSHGRAPMPLRKPLVNERAEGNFSSFPSPRTEKRQVDLVTERSGQGNGNARVEDYTNALSTIIANVIKEISKDAGGIVNLTRSLVDGNANGNGEREMQQSRFNVDVDMDFEEDESPVRENTEFKQPELNAALAVIKKTMALDAADPFNRPVDPVALEIPDYFNVIDTPMDFGTICNNLENGFKYMNSADVLKDVQYIWHNCEKYNKKGDHILELMKRVKTYFIKYWKAAGLHMEPTPAIVDPFSLRHNNRQKDYQPSPLANNFTHLYQNDAGFDQVVETSPGQIQPQQSFSQPQSSSEEDELEEDEPAIDSAIIPKKRQVRGPTRGIKLLKTTGRIKIVTNELGEPIGPEAIQLTSFLGLIARDGNLAPLTYSTWTKMPKENKENMWQKVLTKFDIHPLCRSWALKSIRSKWRNFKFCLKASHYDRHETDEERLADRDERVLPDQWSFLVSQWSSDQWQSISARNKAKRAMKKFNHTTGTKSFARIREEEKAKRPDGQEPSQAELFILTRTRKDGQPVNEETAAVISQLRESGTEDDAFNRVMGLEGKGGGSLFGSNTPSRAEALRMVTQKTAEVVEMKDRLKSVEETCSQMAAQMSAMVSMMANMQKGSPSESFPNADAAILVPVGTSDQAEPISTANHKVPAKQTRGRKKKK